jgi:hypothetical protein
MLIHLLLLFLFDQSSISLELLQILQQRISLKNIFKKPKPKQNKQIKTSKLKEFIIPSFQTSKTQLRNFGKN